MTYIEKEELYPLLFEPVYQEVVWGGEMLQHQLQRTLPETAIPVGESWELCDREDAETPVTNGFLQGVGLGQLVEQYGTVMLGEKFRGGRFPLLIKLIDAGKRLSLQVHPDEAAADRIEKAEPKSEMWYVIAVKSGAKIIAGLKPNCTKQQFLENLNSTEIENYLQVFDSVPGDAYFISAGRIHAIGAGNLLLEIQQNSNSTYRVSDWGRLGADGKPRELHVEKALECINFTDRNSPRVTGVVGTVDHNRKFPIINMCPYFRVDDLRLVEEWIDNADGRSFHLITAIDHPVLIQNHSRECEVQVDAGRTCMIPANFGRYLLTLPESQSATVIRTTL